MMLEEDLAAAGFIVRVPRLTSSYQWASGFETTATKRRAIRIQWDGCLEDIITFNQNAEVEP